MRVRIGYSVRPLRRRFGLLRSWLLLDDANRWWCTNNSLMMHVVVVDPCTTARRGRYLLCDEDAAGSNSSTDSNTDSDGGIPVTMLPDGTTTRRTHGRLSGLGVEVDLEIEV